MEAWVTPLASAIFSGLVVGIVMALYQGKLDQNVENAKDAHSLKFKSVLDKVDGLEKKSDILSVKFDHLDEKVSSLTTKMAVVLTEQRHLSTNISGLREEAKLQRAENLGKVIRKP